MPAVGGLDGNLGEGGPGYPVVYKAFRHPALPAVGFAFGVRPHGGSHERPVDQRVQVRRVGSERRGDLRHAAVSRWLNAGVPPTQVAEWAGHSVRVLLTVYAKCIVGEEQRALRLIDASFAAERDEDELPEPAPPDPGTHHDQAGTELAPSQRVSETTDPHRTPELADPLPAADLPDGSWGL